MSSPEVEEIKNRLNIVELIGEYIRLQKAGSNWKALCPFHNEKTPSFMVSEERQSFHCFGCGKGGDAFSFVMEMEGVGFREALEQLAGKAGVELKTRIMNYESGIREKDEKNKLYKILELAAKWYEKNLWEGKGREKILGYLRGRGLSDDSIKKFRLGYAPEGWRNMLEFLLRKNYEIEEISGTGLLVEKTVNSDQRTMNNNEESISSKNADHRSLITGRCYDRFRGRIIFPIQDILGRVVGFSARVSPGGDEKSAKYVNTPETALYNKSKILYGLNFAKVEIKKKNETVLVEGNTDVIAAHQAGFGNTVAVSGTALTEEQVKILKRYSENIKMGFDMDAAGQAAARRSIKTCLENDLNVKIILLSSGKDAAESLKENSEDWWQAVERAEGVMEYFFKEALSRRDPRVPSEKKKIVQELLNVIKDISNPVEQAHWIKELAEKAGTEERILADVLQKTRARKEGREIPREPVPEKRQSSFGRRIIGTLVAFSEECRREIDRIDPEDFQNGRERDIIKAIKENRENFGLEKMEAIFSDYETKKFLQEAVFEAEVMFGGGGEEGQSSADPAGELRGFVRRLKENHLREKVLQISRDIKEAEASGDKAGAKILMKEFQKLMEEKE